MIRINRIRLWRQLCVFMGTNTLNQNQMWKSSSSSNNNSTWLGLFSYILRNFMTIDDGSSVNSSNEFEIYFQFTSSLFVAMHTQRLNLFRTYFTQNFSCFHFSFYFSSLFWFYFLFVASKLFLQINDICTHAPSA